MFVVPESGGAFTPRINSTSRRVTSALAPLHNRQDDERRKREQTVARLAEAVEAERRREETFTPRVNPPLRGVDLTRRRSVAERPRGVAVAPAVDTAATHRPAINDDAPCTDEVRARLEEAAEQRQHIRAMWARHAEGATMSAKAAMRVMRDVGVTDDTVVDKFLAALGARESHAEVTYDRFRKVFGVLLRACTVLGKNTEDEGGPVPDTSPPQPLQKAPHGTSLRKERTVSPSTSAPPQQPCESTSAAVSAISMRSTPHRATSLPRKSISHRETTEGAERKGTPDMCASTTSPQRRQSTERRYDPLRECSFAPTINSNVDVSSRGSVTRDRRTMKSKERADEIRRERERREGDACTFAPQVLRKSGAIVVPADPPGFAAVVARLAEGRERHAPRFEESLRRAESVTQWEGRCTRAEPFRLRAEERAEARSSKKPLLLVDVELPSGKTGRVTIYPGDDTEDLARSFAAAYALDEEAERLLAGMLRTKLDAVREGSRRRLWV